MAFPSALVLLAHGSRDPRWTEPFERVLGRVHVLCPGVTARLAYLETTQPGLETVAAQLAQSGCRRLRVVPVFLGQGGHVREDVPALVRAVAERYPQLEVELTAAVGEDENVLDAIARACVAGWLKRSGSP